MYALQANKQVHAVKKQHNQVRYIRAHVSLDVLGYCGVSRQQLQMHTDNINLRC